MQKLHVLGWCRGLENRKHVRREQSGKRLPIRRAGLRRYQPRADGIDIRNDQ